MKSHLLDALAEHPVGVDNNASIRLTKPNARIVSFSETSVSGKGHQECLSVSLSRFMRIHLWVDAIQTDEMA